MPDTPTGPWERLRALFPIDRLVDQRPTVAVLRLSGAIGGVGLRRQGLTLGNLVGAIERAFRLPRLKAVALAINSPGGSAVQSALIARRIRALADEKGIPVVAFAEDVAASGGYWLACAADEIFADENSIVGSIGVVSAGFGFADAIRKLGVERRLHVSGERKSMLDPFLSEREEEVARLEAIQREIHESFKAMIRARRGARLKAPEEALFSGEFWTGRRALELGLIDGIADLRAEMRRRFGENVRLKLVAARVPWWLRLRAPSMSGADGAGAWAADAIAAVEERLLWSRFGL